MMRPGGRARREAGRGSSMYVREREGGGKG